MKNASSSRDSRDTLGNWEYTIHKNNNSSEEELPEETISRYLPLTEFETQSTDAQDISNDLQENDSYVLLDLVDDKLRNEGL